MRDLAFIPRSAFVDMPASYAGNSGVTVAERVGLALATVLARKDQSAALAKRLHECFGLDLPDGPRRSSAGDVAFAGIGPDAWLASREGDNGFVISLRETISSVASVSDQSDGYSVLRLTGPWVRETLAKGVPIDLHERAFKTHQVAATTVSHIGAILWRIEDNADGWPVFDIAVFRSLAGSFWHWLSESAAEYGLVNSVPMLAKGASISLDQRSRSK